MSASTNQVLDTNSPSEQIIPESGPIISHETFEEINMQSAAALSQKYGENPQTTTWIGKAPLLQEIDYPFDHKKFEYPPDFANKFNKSPNQAISEIRSTMRQLNEESNLGPFLMYCPNIYPKSLTQYVFSDPSNAHSILYYYFGAVNLEFLTIPEAARILLSRIAFPNNQQHLSTLFNTFASVYSEANPYLPLSRKEIAQVTVACIAFSIFYRKTEVLPLGEFLSFVKTVKVGDAYKEKIYYQLKENPIPIFFEFSVSLEEPNYNKSGLLKKESGGVFKAKSKRFYIIDHFSLKYFKDESKSELIGEIELDGSNTSFVPASKKEPPHMIIKKINGGSIGFTFTKDLQKRRSKETEHVIYENDEDTLLSWTCALNYVSFWSILDKLTINSRR
ncbi:ankyrin repeat-containing protein [Histomonas meleagridis]|uniref:ankyrin repeat-containing protein n=1 Tax=Histomonas meleagridis TaxID=135588 RepID=UPI00355A41D4|nr:ankyrin repeat-containing protein [Histomonas meleagridis]